MKNSKNKKALVSNPTEGDASLAAANGMLPAESACLDTDNLQIGSDVAESYIAEKRIGTRIKNLRLKKSMGLVDLGRHTGLSASFLSQLETGRVVPTLRNLARIAMVFSKDLSYFFEPEPKTLFKVHRTKDRLRLPQSGVEDPMYFFESLGYLVPDRQLDPYLAVFQPKPGMKPRMHHHPGCEFLFLLEGELIIQHGLSSEHLEARDAVYFDSATTHSYSCVGDKPATAIIVTLQQPVQAAALGGVGGFTNARLRSGTASLEPRNDTYMARAPKQ